MSGVLKNRKKREEAEAAAAAALTASANSNLMANVDELLSSQGLIPEPSDSTGKKTKGAAKKTGSGNEEDNESDSDDKKGKAKKGLAPPKSTGAAPAGAKKRKRGESENAEDEPAAKEAATGEPTNKEAEVRINSKGTIDEDGSSSEEDEGEGHSENDNGERDLTASGKPRQKKFIKRRMRRYLSLEDKIAVFERIVKEIDPKTKKLRYGASNEICADYFIGRKTINNIKNLFEGLIREGKDLSSILSAETMTDIPIKLNVDLEAATQPLTDELFNGEEAENEKARQTLLALKQQLQINHATNAASISITNEEDSDSDKEGNDLLHKLKLRVTNSAAAAAAAAASTVSAEGEDGEGGKYKPLFDDETRMRKMLKVNNVGRQTKLNDLTIERIKTIVPYCFGVKELSDMYEKQFGEKIHQSTLWRYCAELNIKIPKKTNKK